MKKQLLFLVLFMCCRLLSNAQPVIDSVNFTPLHQETIIRSKCDYILPNTSITTGANVTWDFTSLLVEATDSLTYMHPDTVGYVPNNCYQYTCFNIQSPAGVNFSMPVNPRNLMFRYSADGMTERGFCQGSWRMQCSYITRFPFPLTYNDSSLNVFYGNGWEIAGPITMTWTDSTVYALNAVGYGTLMLPNTTHTNALLVHVISEETETDPFFCPSGCIFRDTIYYWLVPNIHHPVLEIHFPYYMNINNAFYVSGILFGIESITGNAIINCYPNPFNVQTIFEVNMEFMNSVLKVYNLLGKELKTQTIISPKTVFNRDDLSAGIYFYEIVNRSGNMVTGKFIIQ